MNAKERKKEIDRYIRKQEGRPSFLRAIRNFFLTLLALIIGLIVVIFISIQAVILSFIDPIKSANERILLSSNMSFDSFVSLADASASKIGILNPNNLAVLNDNTYLFPYMSMYDEYPLRVWFNQANKHRGSYVHAGVDLFAQVMEKDSTSSGYNTKYDRMIVAPTRMVIEHIDRRNGVLAGGPGTEMWIGGRIDDGTMNTGLYYRMFHFARINPNLKIGDIVEKGHILGVEGESGSPGAVHLHIEVSTSLRRDIMFNPFTFAQTLELNNVRHNDLISHMSTAEGRQNIEKVLSDYNETTVMWALDPSIILVETKDNLIEPDKVKSVDDFIKVWEDNRHYLNQSYAVLPFYTYPRLEHFIDVQEDRIIVSNGDVGRKGSGNIPGFTIPSVSTYDSEINWETGKWVNQPK